MIQADGAALKGLYIEGAAFKAQIIDCLAKAGFDVQSVRHTGDVHVVQIITPHYLLNPANFKEWEKRQKKPGDGESVPQVPEGK